MTDETKAAEAEPVLRSELHTYPDGSAIVGTPPWPEKSPKQIAAEAMERVGAPAETPAPAPAPTNPQTSNVVTADQLEGRPAVATPAAAEPDALPETPAAADSVPDPAPEPAPVAPAPAPTSSRKR